MRYLIKWIIGFLVVLALVLAALGFFGFWLPYQNATSSLGADRQVSLYAQEDGTVLLRWPEGNADKYFVEIVDLETNEPRSGAYVDEACAILTQLPQRPCIICIHPVAEYDVLCGSQPWLRLGEDTIAITGDFSTPKITDIAIETDTVDDLLHLSLTATEGCVLRLYQLNGRLPDTPVQTYTQSEITLSFGEEKDFPLPSHGQSHSFALDIIRQGDGFTFYGLRSQPIKLSREELLGTELELEVADNGDNTFTLSWNETKGERYTLQYRASEKKTWKTILTVEAGGRRRYVTEAMKPYTSGQYRVPVWQGEEELPLSETQAVTVQQKATVVYSTVWPTQDLPVYIDPEQTQVIGTATAGTAFCVMAVEQGTFAVRWGDGFGFIDSNYCMINLAECMGDLIAYDITNSYASVFKIHEYDIPKITGQTITGYEQVKLTQNQYLVPLLYPVLEKLETAALSAQKSGYKLKIYESFRPQKATDFLYNETIVFSEEQLPAEEGSTTPPNMTYAEFMTDKGRYPMNYFLAKGRSRHNFGVALDLTLEKKGEEVQMQTPMHDLSWYSEKKKNNDDANRLHKIMTEAGFTGLVSEWWHFQDNDAWDTLQLQPLWEGVSAQCWMADQNGWRYRTHQGTYLKNCTRTIDSVRYTFDAQGYVIAEERVE